MFTGNEMFHFGGWGQTCNLIWAWAKKAKADPVFLPSAERCCQVTGTCCSSCENSWSVMCLFCFSSQLTAAQMYASKKPDQHVPVHHLEHAAILVRMGCALDGPLKAPDVPTS